MTENEKLQKIKALIGDCDNRFLSSNASIKTILGDFYNEVKKLITTPSSPLHITKNTFILMLPSRCPLCRKENILVSFTSKSTLIATVDDEGGYVSVMEESEPDGSCLELDYYRCPDCGNEFYFDGEYYITSEELFGQ